MPGGDRTGPQGQGSMTGRRLGICASTGQANTDLGQGRGQGMGRGGRGGGRGNGYGAGAGRRGNALMGIAPTTNDLENRIQELENEVVALREQGNR